MHLIFRADAKKKCDQTAFGMHVSIAIWHRWLLLPSWNIFSSCIVYRRAVFILLMPQGCLSSPVFPGSYFPEPQCQIPSHASCRSSPSMLTPYVTLPSLVVSNVTFLFDLLCLPLRFEILQSASSTALLGCPKGPSNSRLKSWLDSVYPQICF